MTSANAGVASGSDSSQIKRLRGAADNALPSAG
jgi:hypothetical protein